MSGTSVDGIDVACVDLRLHGTELDCSYRGVLSLPFEPVHGLLEVLDPETRRPAGPGEVGTLVATPFPPFRETTILLRYDTQDVVRQNTPISAEPSEPVMMAIQKLCVTFHAVIPK